MALYGNIDGMIKSFTQKDAKVNIPFNIRFNFKTSFLQGNSYFATTITTMGRIDKMYVLTIETGNKHFAPTEFYELNVDEQIKSSKLDLSKYPYTVNISSISFLPDEFAEEYANMSSFPSLTSTTYSKYKDNFFFDISTGKTYYILDKGSGTNPRYIYDEYTVDKIGNTKTKYYITNGDTYFVLNNNQAYICADGECTCTMIGPNGKSTTSGDLAKFHVFKYNSFPENPEIGILSERSKLNGYGISVECLKTKPSYDIGICGIATGGY